jgi:hypothetical protein
MAFMGESDVGVRFAHWTRLRGKFLNTLLTMGAVACLGLGFVS